MLAKRVVVADCTSHLAIVRGVSMIALCLLAGTVACSRRAISVPATSAATISDNSYLDLQPGWTLRIVVPLLKSGSTGQDSAVIETRGNNLTVRSKELIGYETSLYTVERARNGVRVEFLSAEVTREAKTTPQPNAPALPFALPERAGHIRLIYLVRVSQADHNMAIVSAKHLEKLNDFTSRLRTHPEVCRTAGEISCTWVPQGIAVRPEQP